MKLLSTLNVHMSNFSQLIKVPRKKHHIRKSNINDISTIWPCQHGRHGGDQIIHVGFRLICFKIEAKKKSFKFFTSIQNYAQTSPWFLQRWWQKAIIWPFLSGIVHRPLMNKSIRSVMHEVSQTNKTMPADDFADCATTKWNICVYTFRWLK